MTVSRHHRNLSRGSDQVTRAKLTIKQVKEIRARYNSTLRNGNRLALEYNVKSSTIHSIVQHKSWAWVE